MANETEPEIVLCDPACTKKVCFSSVVWRLRLMLNYKRISYKTVFLGFPDIDRTLKKLHRFYSLGLWPHSFQFEVLNRKSLSGFSPT